MCQLGTCHLPQGRVSGWALSCKPRGDELTSPSGDSNEPWAKCTPCFLQFYYLFLLKNKHLSSFYAASTLASMTAFSLRATCCVPRKRLISNTCVGQQWHPVVTCQPKRCKQLHASACQGSARTGWWVNSVSTEVNGCLLLLRICYFFRISPWVIMT